MDIIIDNDQKKIAIDDNLLERMEQVGILALSTASAIDDYEVSVLISDDDFIQTINKQYRNVDRPTDVLSFVLLEDEDSDEPLYFGESDKIILGDIVISAERAKEQSEDFGHSFTRELCYLLVHGILHLLGYDHESDSDKQAMRKMEEKVLMKMDISRDNE